MSGLGYVFPLFHFGLVPKFCTSESHFRKNNMVCFIKRCCIFCFVNVFCHQGQRMLLDQRRCLWLIKWKREWPIKLSWMEDCVCCFLVVILEGQMRGAFTMWCLLAIECVFKHTRQIGCCSVENGIFWSAAYLEFLLQSAGSSCLRVSFPIIVLFFGFSFH